MSWDFTRLGEVDPFYMQFSVTNTGDTLDMPVHEYDLHTTVTNAVTRRNYATIVQGSIRFSPPNDPAFVIDTPGGRWPWAKLADGTDAAPVGDWVWETLEDDTIYACATARRGSRLDYTEHMSGLGVYKLEAETWAVPFSDGAIIEGVSVPRFEIAYKQTGEMTVDSTGLVALITERKL